jgi:eukaryotic-like serine/threonine-protein kinase
MSKQLRPGEQIEHYRIDDVVARGPMASVFRGTDLRTNRPVAIKAPEMAAESDPVFFERFRREAEIGRKLDHPGVVKVFPREDRDGVYLVMEWVEGPLLRTILAREGKLPVERAVKIAMEICDALYYIHSRGVVHRDLKPENIVVDAHDRIKLIDFGIAGEEGARRLTFGKFSNVMGTPDYISPEQIQGKRGDARSDIYALGAILYEMLAGQPPFQGENPFAVMNDRLLNHPVPPCELNPEIPPALQEIIYRALERDRRNRYSSANEMAWDLAHMDQVTPNDRAEIADWRNRRSPSSRKALFYAAVTLVPIAIFVLLFYVSRHS